MTVEDVCNTLKHMGMITIEESTPPPIKPIPGQSIRKNQGRKSGVARRALQRTQTNDSNNKPADGAPERVDRPFVPPTRYRIHWDPDHVDAYLRKWALKGYLILRPEKLKWSPFLVARTKKSDGADGLPATQLPETPATETETSGTPMGTTFDDGDVQMTDAASDMLAKARTAAPGSSPPPDLFADDKDVVIASASHTPQAATRRASRQSSPGSPPPTPAADTSGDFALAASLALEEGKRPTMRLRTRSSAAAYEPPALKRQNSGTGTPASARKRRRVESSAEPEADSEPPTPVSVKGAITRRSRRKEEDLLPEPPTPRRTGQPNGTKHERTPVDAPSDDTAEVKYEDVPTPNDFAGRQSVPSDATIVGEDVRIKAAEDQAQDHDDALREQVESKPQVDGDDAAEGSDADAEGELDAEGEDDDEYNL
jgi:hypothetical protein